MSTVTVRTLLVFYAIATGQILLCYYNCAEAKSIRSISAVRRWNSNPNVNKLHNFVPSTRMMVRYQNLHKSSREITPKITSYGRGYLIYGKNGIVFAEKSNMQEGNLIDVSESGRTVRRYVRI